MSEETERPNAIDLRLIALEHAINSRETEEHTADEVIKRAKKYLAFLRGESRDE